MQALSRIGPGTAANPDPTAGPLTHVAVISTHIPVVTALLRGGANLNVDNVCQSTPIEAAKSKLRMMRMHSPDRDLEGADELFEVKRRRHGGAGYRIRAQP